MYHEDLVKQNATIIHENIKEIKQKFDTEQL